MYLLNLVLKTLYVSCVVSLALYGFQALWLSWHYLRRGISHNEHREAPNSWPIVSIHLPIYNERYVAERVITACTRIEYPRDKLRIRVLDDSDDATRAIVNRAIQSACDAGVDASVIRRPSRRGYKAGALSYAMHSEDAEFIAIFDADFVPAHDFLLNTMPRFLKPGNDRVGFIQSRWGHLNLEDSLLTRCQGIALDGHFVVEQTGRQAAGFAFGFNGSGGIWRRSCIEDPSVGGWQADTLCEDLDLSYRAQLVGWRGLYMGDVESPAEIPPQLLAFKRQQSRWAQGSIQTLRKLLHSVWSSNWNFQKRFAATLHLGSYLLHPMLLLLLLLALPMALTGNSPAPSLAVLSLLSVGPPLLYAIAQHHLYRERWLRNFALLPLLMLFGTGLSFNNSVAVTKGLFGGNSEFLRTPKFNTTQSARQWRESTYRLPLNSVLIVELLLACYASITIAFSLRQDNYFTAGFMMVYLMAFGLVAAIGVWQEWSARATMRRERSRTLQEHKPSGDLRTAGINRDG